MEMYEFITTAFGSVAGAVAAYMAIRENIATLTARVNSLEKVSDNTVRRVDELYTGGK